MMHRTSISIEPSSAAIEHHDSIFTMGSCFSDMIAAKLLYFKWSVVANPFGTLFDPVSISENLVRSLANHPPHPELYDVREDVHLHYQVHSDLSALDKRTLEQKIKEARQQTSQGVKSCRWMIITLGSMIVFEHKKTGVVVANCHKMPQVNFQKRQLKYAEAHRALQSMLLAVQQSNPRVQFIFTVSPVRHIRHGLAENMLSKSHLRILCEDICQGNDNCQYFPSYEIMLDDLRDYQYYHPDGIHPNAMGENYIWEKFCSTYFSSPTLQWMNEWEKIKRAIVHRPQLPEAKAHQKFLHETLAQLERFSPQIDVSAEVALLKQQMI